MAWLRDRRRTIENEITNTIVTQDTCTGDTLSLLGCAVQTSELFVAPPSLHHTRDLFTIALRPGSTSLIENPTPQRQLVVLKPIARRASLVIDAQRNRQSPNDVKSMLLLHSIKAQLLFFAIKPNGVALKEPRQDLPSLFAATPRSRGPSAIVRTKVDRPTPPPNEKSSLEERIRLLLMPPIEQLLSESSLYMPEEPFAYQLEGIAWLLQRNNALLADEMGLGKTMQAIVAARVLHKMSAINQCLVICPKTLIGSWRRELSKWWPGIEPYTVVADSDRRWFLRLATRNAIVKIINYEALSREFEWLSTVEFGHDLVIIDEAQRIKNPSSATARSVKSLKAERRWALTGTPLENRVQDVVSIFDFVKPAHIKNDEVDHIKAKLRPYMLRRSTEEVLTDLPVKIEQDVEVELAMAQRESYDRAEKEGIVELNKLGETVTVTHVFSLICALREICNVDIKSSESAKLDRLFEDMEEIAASNRKTLVFSQFTNERGIRWLSQQLSTYKPLELHGKIPPNMRDSVVEKFSKDPAHKIMLLNYAVGGVGLNLQSANYVYLFDRWWNPAVEDQAVKRAHRLGQKDRVFVRRFVCKDTIEERIVRKLREKRVLFEAVIDDAQPHRSMGLTEEELFGLFNLTVRRRRTQSPAKPSAVDLNNLSRDITESCG